MLNTCLRTAVTFACLSLPVFADPALECGIANGSQVEIGNCVGDAERRVETTIALALGFASDAATELDQITGRDTSLNALIAGQAAWAEYRDQHCEFIGTTFVGGSGTGIAITACRIELGRERVDALMRFTR